MGDIRQVNVAVAPGNRHSGAVDKRHMPAGGLSGVGFRHAQPQITRARTFAVKIQPHPVAALLIRVRINVVLFPALNARRQRAVDGRTRDFHRTEAVALAVWHSPYRYVQAGITRGAVSGKRDDNPLFQRIYHIALRLQHLTRRQVRGVTEQVNARGLIQFALVMHAGVKRPAFRFRLRVAVVPGFLVRGGVTIVFTAGHRIVAHADGRIQRRGGRAVVVVAGNDAAGDHVMPAAHVPHRFFRTVEQPRRLAVRQAHVKLVVKLAVGKDVHVQLPRAVHLRAPVNPHFRQQPPDKLQIRLPPPGYQLTRRVGAHQTKCKISPCQSVLAQHLCHHLRYRLILVYGAFPAVRQQRQARAEPDCVVRLVSCR